MSSSRAKGVIWFIAAHIKLYLFSFILLFPHLCLSYRHPVASDYSLLGHPVTLGDITDFLYSCELAVSQSVVDIATGLGAGRTGVRISLVDFFICVHVQTGNRSHLGFTLMVTGILSRG